MSDLEGYPIEATNGAIGQVTDFLFDDESWVVRYLVVQTGEWLSNRSVLISSIAIGQPTWSYRTLRVPMTTDQVRNSPDADTNRPEEDRVRVEREVDQHRNDDRHLRSANAVKHYHVKASDGGIGHVQGLLLDEDTWDIRYLIVDTSDWWLGHKVLIAPQWIQDVSWSEHAVSINLTQEEIKASPHYDSAGTLHRHEEASLFDHYRRVGYWADHVRQQNPEFRTVEPAPVVLVDKHS